MQQGHPFYLRRIFAFCVDLTAILFLSLAFILAVDLYLNFITTNLIPLAPKMRLQLQIVISIYQLSLIPITMLLYFTLSLYISNGQTWGKLLMGQRIESKHETLSLKSCFLRSIAYSICVLSCGFFFIANFLREDGLGLADYLSQSYSNSVTENSAKVITLPTKSQSDSQQWDQAA